MRLRPRGCFRLLVLAVVVLWVQSSTAMAAGLPPNDDGVRHSLEARGVGQRVKVVESNGTVLRGKIMSLDEGHFTFQSGTRPPMVLPYSEIREVRGPGLSKGAKIGLVVGGVAVVVLILGAAVASAVPKPGL